LKKLSVILLALALTFSLAAVAAAANFDPYLGGEFQVIYNGTKVDADGKPDKDGDVINPIDTEGSWGTWARFKLMLTGTVEDEETGTWALIGARLSTWNFNNDVSDDVAGLQGSDHAIIPIYQAGIKGLLDGTLDIWYNDHEYENAKRGQIPLWTPMAKFGGDPLFDNAPEGVFAADYNSGNVTVNFGVDINKGSKDNDPLFIGAGTFAFDAGEFRAAFLSEQSSDARFLVGGAYELDFGKIEADFLQNSPDKGDDTSAFQASISLADLGLKGIFVYDDGITFADGGLGFGVEFTGIEDVVLGARMMLADKKEDEGANFNDFYAGYNFGIFETRVGMYTTPEADYDDGVFYAAAHVGMW